MVLVMVSIVSLVTEEDTMAKYITEYMILLIKRPKIFSTDGTLFQTVLEINFKQNMTFFS